MTKKLDNNSFSLEIEKMPAIVDFYTDACGPCKKLAPVIDKLAIEFAGIVTIAKVNAADNMELCGKYKISAVPTIISFKDGKEIKRVVGMVSENKLREMAKEIS